MKPVRYPSDKVLRSALKQRYVAALNTLNMQNGNNRLEWCQKKWNEVRRRIPHGSHYPADVRKILKAEYPKLVAYYLQYISDKNHIVAADVNLLYRIFSYDAFHETIAEFFMDGKNGFNLSVCHYCGLAYINKYTIEGVKDGLDIINCSGTADMERLLNIHSPRSLQKLIDHAPYATVDDFNRVGVFRCRDKFHSVFPDKVDKNHFDLDHVLDKGNCPITAISLMNFVPSCSVCNEKLKKQKVLGQGRIPIVELSPTSSMFDFDGQVRFMLMPKAGRKIGNRPTRQADDYELKMDVKKAEYENYVEMFHLRERYEFHKMEALFWMELKYRYTDSRIELMANSLKDAAFSTQRIKDDIFQRTLDNRERCFEKLKRDMLK